MARENETGYLPPLKTKIKDLDRYDTIFVGAPTWGMQLPPPMKSFLRTHDLAGKTVVPFDTNASYGIGSSFETVRELCPRSRFLRGYSTKGGIERDGIHFVMTGEKAASTRAEINEWLNGAGILIRR